MIEKNYYLKSIQINVMQKLGPIVRTFLNNNHLDMLVVLRSLHFGIPNRPELPIHCNHRIIIISYIYIYMYIYKQMYTSYSIALVRAVITRYIFFAQELVMTHRSGGQTPQWSEASGCDLPLLVNDSFGDAITYRMETPR